MHASEESTEQRLDRWHKLRDHLRDYGLHKKPPDDLLLEPEPATRPNVRLVAYYDKIKQESTGKKTDLCDTAGVFVMVDGKGDEWKDIHMPTVAPRADWVSSRSDKAISRPYETAKSWPTACSYSRINHPIRS